MSRIVMFDYLEQYEELREDVQEAVARVLESGRLILGSEVIHFEEEFAHFLHNHGVAVGLASGTDAVVVALLALGVGPGDEVVTVANTAVATVSAIRVTGATPVFCDVDPHTALMDLEQLDATISERTRAVVPVHLFGNVVDVPAIRDVIGNRDIRIVEDCAQAHGARLGERAVGTMGDVGAFSFYPTKNLGAYGDAGLCYSGESILAEEMRRVRMYGFQDGPRAMREGINSRLDELQAAVLRVKLRRLPEYVAARRELAARYREGLHASVELVAAADRADHAYHLFVVKVAERDRVRETLAAKGVDTGVHYPHPIHLMPAYRFLGYREGSLPHTEALSASVLSLPLYPELSQESVDRVCHELNDALA
jgi:aminotransferase EvaB